MDIKISSKFAIIILGIGILSTLLAVDKSFPVESANAQMNMGSGGGGQGMDGGGGSSGMGGGSSGMGGGGGHGMDGNGGSSGMGGGGAGHGMMMMMTNVPGFVQQICHTGKDMPPSYCEPNYQVMSSVKGLKISSVNPINDNELQVVIENINSMSNTTTTMGQQNIVVAGGGGDLAGSTVLDIAGGGSQKITTELKLIGSGSIYNLERIYLHLLPLTSQ
ncbi:MAG TPA: hypothetical protein VF047_11010 [Nitrososphaeraceae archaeon]